MIDVGAIVKGKIESSSTNSRASCEIRERWTLNVRFAELPRACITKLFAKSVKSQDERLALPN